MSRTVLTHGDGQSPISLELIGKGGAGKDGAPQDEGLTLIISGGDLQPEEAIELAWTANQPAELQILASSSPDRTSPSLEIVAGGGLNIKRTRKSQNRDQGLVCQIVAAGGGNLKACCDPASTESPPTCCDQSKAVSRGSMSLRLEGFANEADAEGYLRSILRPEVAETFLADRSAFDGQVGTLDVKRITCKFEREWPFPPITMHCYGTDPCTWP